MKTAPSHAKKNRGSALITVIFLIVMMSLLTTSMLRYSGSEQRFNERQRMILRSRNMSENAVIYASEQITNKLYKLRSGSPMWFTGTNGIDLPPSDVIVTKFSQASDIEVRAGLTATSGLRFIDPADAANAGNPNAGLQISNSTVPIIAKSTMTHSALGPVTTYAQQDLEVAMMPLFQFAIFYNMDMEFGPGPNMTISGPVHTNGDFIARIQTGMTNTLRFRERVTTAKGFYANTAHKGGTYMAAGNLDNGPGGTGALIFHRPTGDTTGTEIRSSTGIWRDHKWTSSSTPNTVAETATSKTLFKNFATATYLGNLRTQEHGVQPLKLPAIGDYDEDDATKKKNGRQLIETPVSGESGGVLGTKFSRNTGLYIIVNPDATARAGHKPDGSSVTMRPRSYRAFLNKVNSPGNHTVTEVVLPGQPSYGDLNAFANTLPNAYRVDTSVGSNQVLRIPQGNGSGYVDLPDTGYAWSGAIPDFDATPTPAEILTQDAYFYDMRRAYNNVGYPFNRSAALRFRPRPIAKIDFDMTRFRMAVQRTLFSHVTSTVYNPALPHNGNWASSIYNPSATAAAHGLGLAPLANTAFNAFPARDTVSAVVKSQAATLAPTSVLISSFNGVGATATDYSANYRIETTTAAQRSDGTYTGWSTQTDVTTPAADHTFSPSASATAMRITQFPAGTLTGALDVQTIPILNATSTAVSASLTNDQHMIAWQGNPTSSTTPALNAYINVVTEMRVYVGAIDDTANWTFHILGAPATLPNAGGSVTATLGTTALGTYPLRGYGTHANRLTVTAMATATNVQSADIVITARKRATGGSTSYTTISKTFRIFKQPAAVLPNQNSFWITAGGAVAPDPFRIYRAPTTASEVAAAATDPAPYIMALADYVTTGSEAAPWFDGITVYVESVSAENLTVAGTGNSTLTDRVASGVRLWNGRGPAISLAGADYPNRTGFSFATNDALYLVGHFNANGSTDSNTNNEFVGGYSGKWPDNSSEMLTALMGDALTILSQPRMERDGSAPNYTYYHDSGWTDSLSAHRRDTSANWSASWFSSNPSNSNTQDGISDSVQPALLPNLTVSSAILSSDTATSGLTVGVARPGPRAESSSGTFTPAGRTAKFSPSETEVSTCLLTGIVPTTVVTATGTTAQTSGGVHNFPRLSENWGGNVALYIRGSLVAMFESQVATEPWSIRWYQGAIRNWGLHNSLRGENGEHDVPLEPIVLGARRMSYRELSKQEYDAQKVVIEALPH